MSWPHRWSQHSMVMTRRLRHSTWRCNRVCCAICGRWSVTTPKTSPRRRGCTSPATCPAAIARPRALDHLRHHRRRPAVATPIEELAELPAGQPDVGEQAVEAISTDQAVALIATLPRDQAEAVLLRVVMGLDAEGAARVLGKRAGAVRVAAHRGLRRLAARLNQLPHDSRRPGVTPGPATAPGQMR